MSALTIERASLDALVNRAAGELIAGADKLRGLAREIDRAASAVSRDLPSDDLRLMAAATRLAAFNATLTAANLLGSAERLTAFGAVQGTDGE